MARYRIGKPDEALIVTGSFLGKEGIKILKNSGTFVIPIVQNAHKLSLLTHKLEIGTPEVYTEQGVPILASATVLVKVGNSVESIKTAAEQYLGKSTSELEDEARYPFTHIIDPGYTEVVKDEMIEMMALCPSFKLDIGVNVHPSMILIRQRMVSVKQQKTSLMGQVSELKPFW